MALVRIIPSPLSRKFGGIDGAMTQYDEVESQDGSKQVRSLGEYKRERFPNSTQGERPILFSTKNKINRPMTIPANVPINLSLFLCLVRLYAGLSITTMVSKIQ